MTVLPDWDNPDVSELSDSVRSWLAVLTYLTALCFACLLVFAFLNSYRILLKVNQRRHLCDPMTVFYIVAICTVILRLLSVIFWA